MATYLNLYINVDLSDAHPWLASYAIVKRILEEGVLTSEDFKNVMSEEHTLDDSLTGKTFFARSSVKRTHSSKLTDYDKVFPIIIINGFSTDRDFYKLMPIVYFLELDINQVLHFGFNISTLPYTTQEEIERKTRFRFSINHFLFPLLDVSTNARRFFFIDGQYGRVSFMSPSNNEVLRRYTPLLNVQGIDLFDTVNVSEVVKILNTPVENIRLDYKSKFTIDYSNLALSQLILRRLADLPSRVKLGTKRPPSGRKTLLNNIITYFSKQPSLVVYFMLLYYEVHLADLTESEVQRHLTKTRIKNLNSTFKQYYYGIKEIIENIKFHADKGYIYIATNRISDIDKIEQNSGVSHYLHSLVNDGIKSENRILEISIFDISKEGILDSFHKHSSFVKLKDLFVGTYLSEDKSHLNLRYASHLGLKSFTKTVLANKGYFKVQTTNNKASTISNEFFSGNRTGEEYLTYDEHLEPLPGTNYRIILRFEDLFEFSGKEITTKPYSYESVSKTLIDWLNDPTLIPKFEFPTVISEKVELGSKEEQLNFIHKFGSDFLKNASPNSTLCIDYNRFHPSLGMDYSLLVKILSFIQLSSNSEAGRNIVIFNCPSDTVWSFISGLEIIATKGAFWNEECYLYLYDEQGVPFIINGQDIRTCYLLNEKVRNLYQGKHYWLLNTDIPNLEEFNFAKGVLPLEVVLRFTNNDGVDVTIFDHYVNQLLNISLTSNELGLKIQGAHVRLGAKIITANFYEASILFKKSFFVDRYAFYIAKDIIEHYPKGKSSYLCDLVILGYADYSELLVNRIKYFVSKSATSTSAKINAYFICEDDEQLAWRLLNHQNQFFRKREKVGGALNRLEYLMIVPINSTFSTNQKMISSYNDIIKSLFPNDLAATIVPGKNLRLNYGLIFIRDYVPEIFTNLTDREKEFISSITSSKVVSTQVFVNGTSGVKFYSYSSNSESERNWLAPINLVASFPEEKELSLEKPVVSTNKSSLSPDFLLGWPRLSQEQRDTSDVRNFARIKTFRGYLKEGPIVNGGLRQIYYFDTERYVDSRNKELVNWLTSLAKLGLFANDSSHHIIVSVSKGIQLEFIHLVNDLVFKNKASVISFDFKSEFRDNVIQKYRYLKQYSNIRFHFVDHVLHSGDSFYGTVNYLSSVLDRQVKFESILVLINRLSKYRLESILDNYIEHRKRQFKHGQLDRRNGAYKSSFFSFVNLYVPPIRNPDTFCFVTQRQVFYKTVLKKSKLAVIKHYLSEKVSRLASKSVHEVELAFENRYFDRLQLIHQAYHSISQAEPTEFKNASQILDELWTKNIGTRYEKINLIKVFSSPPLSHYHEIKKFILEKMLIELDALLNNSNPDLIDFNLLVCLMKQLTYLNSNFIIRKESIRRVWMFYFRLRQKSLTFIENDWIDTDNRNGLIEAHVFKILLERSTNEQARDYYGGRLSSVMKSMHLDYKNYPWATEFKNAVEAILDQLNASVEDLRNYGSTTAKSIASIVNFSILYSSLVKQLIFNDQSKSYWVEYLLRTGHEVPKLNGEYKFEGQYDLPENEPYNDLYKIKTKFLEEVEVDNPKLFTTYSRFLVMIFLENVTILQKGFDQVHKLFVYNERINRNKNLEHLKEVFANELSKDPYYFRHFKKFFQSQTGTIASQTLTNKIASLLLLKAEMALENNTIGLQQQVQTGLDSLRGVMEADHAVFSVFRRRNQSVSNVDESKLDSFSTGALRHDLYALVKCSNSSNLKDGIEFSPISETYNFFDKGLSFDLFTIKQATPETKLYEEYNYEAKPNFQSSIVTVLRLFVSKNRRVECGVTFIQKNVGNDIRSVKTRIKESIRLILLIKDDLHLFLEKNYNNDNFQVLLSELDRKLYLGASTHGASKSLEIIKRVFDQNVSKSNPDYLEFLTEYDSLYIRSKHRFVLTNLSYSDRLEDKIEVLVKNKISLSKLNESKITSIKQKIQTILRSKHRNRQKDALIQVTMGPLIENETHFFDLIEDFILELTDNAKKSLPGNNSKIEVSFNVDGNCLVIEYKNSSRPVNERLLQNLNVGHYEKASGALNLINIFVTKILDGKIAYGYDSARFFSVKIVLKKIIHR